MSQTHNTVAVFKLRTYKTIRCHSALHESSSPHELKIFSDPYILDVNTNWKWVVSCTFRPLYSLRWVSYGSGYNGGREKYLYFSCRNRTLASGHTRMPVGKVGRTERGSASVAGSGSGVQARLLR